MKLIQWFPGHMAKAMKMMRENLDLCDAAAVILDARCPYASINRKHDELFAAKPVLYVLNKADLADEGVTKAWLSYFSARGAAAIALSASDPKGISALRRALNTLSSPISEKYRKKGQNHAVRIMVAGIPNTGKSTVINALSGAKKAVTGDKAGVTRDKQWIRLDGVELLDTPGVMPPSFENQTLAKHLAYCGAINDDILDFPDLCTEFLAELSSGKYRALLTEKYGITGEEDRSELLFSVAKRRGFLLRGGEYDYERAAHAALDDFRKGKIGKISLETPEDAEKPEETEKPDETPEAGQ